MAQLHPQRLVAGLAATRRSMGDGTIRGRARLATPYRRVAPTVQDVVDMTDPAWPAEPCDCCPDPWAWYRGDDLVYFAEGDRVRLWPDRAVGGRDLDDSLLPSGTNYPHYTATAVAGQPGIRAGAAYDDLAATYTGSPVTFDEASVLCVVKAPDSGSLSLVMQPAGAFNNVNVIVYKDYVEAFSGGAYSGGISPAAECAVLMVQTVDLLRLWVNGTEITYDTQTAATGPSESDRHIAEMSVNSGSATDAYEAEIKIWLEALSADCIAAEHAYTQARYGL